MSSISIAERPSSTSYLRQLDAASDADKFLLVRRWIDNEPLSFFAELRANRPVLVTPVCTLVTRLRDVLEVLSQPKISPSNSTGRR